MMKIAVDFQNRLVQTVWPGTKTAAHSYPSTVQLASRICAYAQSKQSLVSRKAGIGLGSVSEVSAPCPEAASKSSKAERTVDVLC
jgi:hypothetical protein